MTNPDSQDNLLHYLLQLLSQEGSGAFQIIDMIGKINMLLAWVAFFEKRTDQPRIDRLW
jgi:hypothetical protein